MIANPSARPERMGLITVFLQRATAGVLLALWPVLAWSVDTDAGSQAQGRGEAATDRPERIVTLYQGATDTAVALGIEPVGVVNAWVEKPMYRYLRPYLQDPHYLGLETQPNLEDIAWLRPDLIFAADLRHSQIGGLLARIAPTLVLKSVYRFKETLRQMGQATGREDRANALLEQWRRRVQDFQRRISDALGDAWPQEVAVIGFKSDHARIYYGGFPGVVLDELGFRRPPNHRRETWGVKLTGMESIPAMNADVFFVFMDTSDPAVVANYERWRAHPLWRTLDAVRHGRVHQVDAVTWNMGAGVIAANAMLDDLYRIHGLEPDRVATSGGWGVHHGGSTGTQRDGD